MQGFPKQTQAVHRPEGLRPRAPAARCGRHRPAGQQAVDPRVREGLRTEGGAEQRPGNGRVGVGVAAASDRLRDALCGACRESRYGVKSGSVTIKSLIEI